MEFDKLSSGLARAETLRIVDIKINVETPGFTKPEIILIRIRYPRKNLKFNQSACHFKMRSLTFEKPVFISDVDGF